MLLGFPYLAGNCICLRFRIDLYNGEIISHAINARANFEQITEMPDKAFEKLPDDTGLILHSDQGWQYQNVRYQKRLSFFHILYQFFYSTIQVTAQFTN